MSSHSSDATPKWSPARPLDDRACVPVRSYRWLSPRIRSPSARWRSSTASSSFSSPAPDPAGLWQRLNPALERQKLPICRLSGERGTEESNLALRFWRPPCYRYTSSPRDRHCRPRRVQIARRTRSLGAPRAAGGSPARPGAPGRADPPTRGAFPKAAAPACRRD
jgi:hypothetical protein